MKLAYFTCYCFLYALRNAGASVLRVIRKPSEFKGTYPDAFETSARILPFPRLYEMPVVSIKEWRKGVHRCGILVRASLTNAAREKWRRSFLGARPSLGCSPVTLSATWNIIKPRLFSLDFETSPGVRLPFAVHDKLCMAEHFNGLVSFCV